MDPEARLYLLATSSVARRPLIDAVQAALRGGVDLVQLREKDISDDAFEELARALLPLVRAAGATFIVNDRVDVAARVGAHGVHLGQEDMSVPSARERLPAGTLIGVSTHDENELSRALADGADYVGVGSVFATATKGRAVAVSGPEALSPFAARAETAGVPAFAIGGITADNARAVVAAGFRRIAVCAGILETDDPESAARAIRAVLVTP